MLLLWSVLFLISMLLILFVKLKDIKEQKANSIRQMAQ